MGDLASCAEVAEVFPGRFHFAALTTYEGFKRCRQAAYSICYCTDDELVYEPFFADFGPLNLGLAYRYCQRTAELLKEAQHKGKLLLHFCGPQPQAKANAAVLVGCFQVLMCGRTAEAAYECMRHMEPFLAFRDASSGPPCFGLTVLSTIKGVARARTQGLLDLRRFNISEYEFYERVENGDSTWIIPGKMLAFSGPAAVAENFYGYKTKVPEDYWTYFKQKGVTAVVRLNKPLYNSSRFTAAGLRHYELYFPDGSCPTEGLVDQFLAIAESEVGALAIHCKAGLGRTGVLICCYLMKHHGFAAKEALGYIRVCRPGSVIGPQQNFVVAQEARMQAAGAEFCKAKEMQLLSGAAALQQVPRDKPAPPQQQPLSSGKLAAKALRGVQISASCQMLDLQSAASAVTQLTLEPQAPTPPVQTTSSRLTAFLRFKPPSVKALTGRTSAAKAVHAVAPNGQPRKIPTAILAAGEQGLRAFAADEDQPNSAKGEQWTITSSRVIKDAQDCTSFSPLRLGMPDAS